MKNFKIQRHVIILSFVFALIFPTLGEAKKKKIINADSLNSIILRAHERLDLFLDGVELQSGVTPGVSECEESSNQTSVMDTDIPSPVEGLDCTGQCELICVGYVPGRTKGRWVQMDPPNCFQIICLPIGSGGSGGGSGRGHRDPAMAPRDHLDSRDRPLRTDHLEPAGGNARRLVSLL